MCLSSFFYPVKKCHIIDYEVPCSTIKFECRVHNVRQLKHFGIFASLHLDIFRNDTITESHHSAFRPCPPQEVGTPTVTDCEGSLRYLKGWKAYLSLCSLFFIFSAFSFLFFSFLASYRFKFACFALSIAFIPSFHFVRAHRDALFIWKIS